MNSFVDRVAEAIEKKIEDHDLGQSLDLVIETGKGVDPDLARRFFGQQLKTSLQSRGYVFPAEPSGLRLELVVSIHDERVWAIGALVETRQDQYFQIALETPRYSALDAALGVRRNFVERRTWEATPVGHLGSEVLGLGIFPMENTPQGTVVAAVHEDGVRIYQFLPGGLSKVGQPYPFKQAKMWPRVRKAWLAARGVGKLDIVTTAGDAWVLDMGTAEWKKNPSSRVTISQMGGLGESSFATASLKVGSVTLRAPFRDAEGSLIGGIPKNESIRALSHLDNEKNWIWVNGRGELKRSFEEGAVTTLSERVGDQLAVADLNGSGRLEVITTSAASIGEPDELLVRSLSGDGKRLNVIVYRASFQGSITGITLSLSDYLDLPTVWFVEQTVDGGARLWKLEAGR